MNRFHNKYHRHNHHTLPTTDEPDSSHDPIASPADPFKGSFHILGQLSATTCVMSALTVHNDAIFTGSITIPGPITTSYERLLITPITTTTGYTFKIDSTASTLPLASFYAAGSPKFYMQYNGYLGLGTDTPRVLLDVVGNASMQRISATSLSASSYVYTKNLTSTEDTYIYGVSISRNSNIITFNNTVLDTAICFTTNTFGVTNNSLILSANNTNKFSGSLGVGVNDYTPLTNTLTISGDQSFKNNGYILLDNTYNNTLRIINNRDKSDDQQHTFMFDMSGNCTVGNIPYNMVYNCLTPRAWNTPDQHKINAVSLNSDKSLSITSITQDTNTNGSTIRLFKLNGNVASQGSVLGNQEIGGIRAYAYNPSTGFSVDGNASIQFFSNNIQTVTDQGSYITFNTIDSGDDTCSLKKRMIIENNGDVGINTTSTANAKLAVYGNSDVNPTLLVKSGSNASIVTEIHSGGNDAIVSKTSLLLNDQNLNINNSNHITFASNRDMLARITCTHLPTTTDTGGALVFSTSTAKNILQESLRIKCNGDVNIGGLNSSNAKLCVASSASEAIEAYSLRECSFSLYTSPTLQSSNTTPNHLTLSTSTTGNNILSNNVNLIIHTDNIVTFKNRPDGVFVTLDRNLSTFVGPVKALQFQVSSDYKLKHNITPIKDSLNKIDTLRGVNFNWNIDNTKDIGVIAQDVEKIIPEAVSQDEEGYKTVSYDKIIPLLIECIKDLKREIKELKDSIN